MSSTDEERWLAAERRIAPRPSPERRRANGRAWLLVIGVGLAYGVITGLARALLPGGGDAPPDSGSATTPLLWLGLAVAGLGALVVLAGLIAGLATRGLRPNWDRVDGALTWRQNRSVRRQIRGQEPVADRRQAVVQAVAEQEVRAATALVPCYLGAALMALGLLVALDLPESAAITAGLLILLGGSAIWQYGYSVRAARKYLS